MSILGHGNLRDRNAGFAAEQESVWGFSKGTAIDSKNYFAPGAKIFYVDPNNTQAVDNGNLGEDPTVPLATVAKALTLCRGWMGDTIIIGADDAWQYSTNDTRPISIQEEVTIPSDKGGIRIVGAGANPMSVLWEPQTNSAAAITVHATDVLIEGITFYPGGTSQIGILAEWDSTADHFGENLTVRNCAFVGLDYGIQMDYSWYNQFYGCLFEDMAAAAVYNVGAEGDAEYGVIEGCIFRHVQNAIDFSTLDSAADYWTVRDCQFNNVVGTAFDFGGCKYWVVEHNVISVDHAAGVCIEAAAGDSNVISDNVIYGDPTAANNFINLTGGSVNVVAGNYLGCSVVQYDVTCSDATSGAWVNNHCTTGDPVLPPI